MTPSVPVPTAADLVVPVVPWAAADDGPTCYSRLRNEWLCGEYLVDRREVIVEAVWQHLGLTFAALALGLLLAAPLALVARRLPRLEAGVLALTTGIYTIPSLALFPLLLPFTGLSATTVVIGLALYALTILVRAMIEGLRGVPPAIRESATGLGYSSGQRLLRVELPLALPVIMAGLRVAGVSTVALTTVGALVSYGGLGNLLITGVGEQFRAQILTASVLCVVLAVTLDALLVLVQRVLTPWTRT